MNVRFFYDDFALELIGFSDFQGGYGAVTPNPPYVNTYNVGPAFFGFTGAAEFVNGAIQIVNTNAPPIILGTANWTKIFQVCFNVDDPNPNEESFCPSLVWDLEQNPANGGYLTGDEGVVITIKQPSPGTGSEPVTENVDQFNWMYTGTGSAPFGQPVQEDCAPLTAPVVAWLTMTCPADVAVECDASVDPEETGTATAEDNCGGDPSISYRDNIRPGACANEYTILRKWTVINECEMSSNCTQTILVTDTTPPEILGVPASSCVGDPLLNNITAVDNCGSASLHFTEIIIPNPSGPGKVVQRTYTSSDECGNTSSATVILQKKGSCRSPKLMSPDVAYLDHAVGADQIAQIAAGINTEAGTQINDISLWPNPANGIVNVSFESTIGQDVKLSLINFLGNVVFNDLLKPTTSNHTQSINVANLPPGSYLMKVQTALGMHTKILLLVDNN